jgi:membrane protease YdiL (CAAX protease family)
LSVRLLYFLVLAVLPAVCEELAFRGFNLGGLGRRCRPLTAVFLSSFLFALYQMNVFQFPAHFVFGLVLALLVRRTGSVLSAVVFHLVFNGVLLLPLLVPGWPAEELTPTLPVLLLGAGCAVTALALLVPVLLMPRAAVPPGPETAARPPRAGSRQRPAVAPSGR